jgi:hypothetical protein
MKNAFSFKVRYDGVWVTTGAPHGVSLHLRHHLQKDSQGQ